MQSFRIIRPSSTLSPYIHHYWILKDDSPIIVTERVTPIGSVQLVFHRNQRLRIQKENSMQPQSFVGGQTITYYDVASTGDLNMIVVVVQPYAAQFLLHQPAHLFNELKVSIDDTSDMPDNNHLFCNRPSNGCIWPALALYLPLFRSAPS